MEHKVLICDDDSYQARSLAEMVEKAAVMANDEDHQLILDKVATSFDDVLPWVINNQVKKGVYFLDVELTSSADKTGLDLAEKIAQVDSDAIFIFVTAHEEMAAATFTRRIMPLDYIVKQPDKEYMQKRITETMELVIRRFKTMVRVEEEFFEFRVGRRYSSINVHDVLYVETTSQPHKLRVISRNGVAEFLGGIGEVQKENDFLVKISQSCLVNFENVAAADLKQRTLIMTSGKELEISRRFVRKVREEMAKGD